MSQQQQQQIDIKISTQRKTSTARSHHPKTEKETPFNSNNGTLNEDPIKDIQSTHNKLFSRRSLLLIILQVFSLFEMSCIGIGLHIFRESNLPLHFSILITIMLIQRLLKILWKLKNRKIKGAILTVLFLDYLDIYFQLKKESLNHPETERKDKENRKQTLEREKLQIELKEIYIENLCKIQNDNVHSHQVQSTNSFRNPPSNRKLQENIRAKSEFYGTKQPYAKEILPTEERTGALTTEIVLTTEEGAIPTISSQDNTARLQTEQPIKKQKFQLAKIVQRIKQKIPGYINKQNIDLEPTPISSQLETPREDNQDPQQNKPYLKYHRQNGILFNNSNNQAVVKIKKILSENYARLKDATKNFIQEKSAIPLGRLTTIENSQRLSKQSQNKLLLSVSEFKSRFKDLISKRVISDFQEAPTDQDTEHYFLANKWQLFSVRIWDSLTLTAPSAYIIGWILTNRFEYLSDYYRQLMHISLWSLIVILAVSNVLLLNIQVLPFRHSGYYLLIQLAGIIKNGIIISSTVLNSVILWGFASRAPLTLLVLESIVCLIVIQQVFSNIRQVYKQQILEDIRFCLFAILISFFLGIFVTYILIFVNLLLPLDSFLMRSILTQAKVMSSSATLNLDDLMKVQFKCNMLNSSLIRSHIFFPLHSLILLAMDAEFNSSLSESWYSQTMFYRKLAMLFLFISTLGIIILFKEYSSFFGTIEQIIVDVIRRLQMIASALRLELEEKQTKLQAGIQVMELLQKEITILKETLETAQKEINECQTIELDINNKISSFGGNQEAYKNQLLRLKSIQEQKAKAIAINDQQKEQFEASMPLFLEHKAKVEQLSLEVENIKVELKNMENVNGVKL